tara:strand:+ start:1333 stop:1524 length:192 start_codon:yes stop_codon:yes gene_type:complete
VVEDLLILQVVVVAQVGVETLDTEQEIQEAQEQLILVAEVVDQEMVVMLQELLVEQVALVLWL